MSSTSAHRRTVVGVRIQTPRRVRYSFPSELNVITIIGPFYEQPMDPDRYQNAKMVERARKLFSIHQ